MAHKIGEQVISKWASIREIGNVREKRPMKQPTTSFMALAIWVFVFLWSVSGLAGPVPDTGQTKCYDNEKEIPCPQPGEAFYGQDAQYRGPSRSYTKLGQNGATLSASATQAGGWIMTRDNVTGLIWEIKQDKDEDKNYSNPHDADNKYTWYDSNPATNGGYAGTSGNGTDTQDFIAALNNANFGGFSDWRLPTVKELSTLVNAGIPCPGPTIDAAWFPLTVSSSYWSSTYCADSGGYAWEVSFNVGDISSPPKSVSYYVRGVRGGQ
jgi:hypothetical protein